jgi:hypothetical protein
MSHKIPVAVSFTGVANFLGVIGAIDSLIFVGLELQQSQQIALGGQQQARTALIAELWLAGLEGESETLTAMQSEWVTLTPHQKSVREQMQRFFWTMLENNFYQYELGLVEDTMWNQMSQRISTRWSECHLRHVGIDGYYQGFIDYVQSLPDECAE